MLKSLIQLSIVSPSKPTQDQRKPRFQILQLQVVTFCQMLWVQPSTPQTTHQCFMLKAVHADAAAAGSLKYIKYIGGCFSCLFADAGFTLSSYDTRALMSSKKHRDWNKISRPSDHQQWLLLNWLSFSLISLLVVFYHIQAVSIKWVIIKFLKCYDSPNDEFHFAPASRVHQDGNQLWISRTKDAVRPNCNCEEALLLVTSLEDQLNTKNRIGYSCKRVSATSRLQL